MAKEQGSDHYQNIASEMIKVYTNGNGLNSKEKSRRIHELLDGLSPSEESLVRSLSIILSNQIENEAPPKRLTTRRNQKHSKKSF